MIERLLEQRLTSSARSSSYDNSSATPPLSIPQIARRFAYGAGVTALGTSPASAMNEPPAQVRTAGKAFLTSEEYVSIDAKLMTMHRSNLAAMEAFNSRLSDIAAVVSLLAQHTLQDTAHERHDGTALDDPATILNRAADEGILEPAVLALAERELKSGDRYARLAALRTIALADHVRGKELIEAELSKGDIGKAARDDLEGTLRAIA